MRMYFGKRFCGLMIGTLLCGAAALPFSAGGAASEQHFDTLTIGTQTYTNVTVTTRNKSYVFFLHDQGMVNFKVAELSQEEKEMLGYEVKKVSTNTAKTFVNAALKKMDSPQMQQIEKTLQARLQPTTTTQAGPDLAKLIGTLTSVPVLATVAAVMLALYLFGCYCCAMICKKAGTEPGAMIWFPVLQMFPLLRAAQMSPLWFVAMMLPLLNIVAHVVWCVRIAKARGKGIATAIFLILPVTNIFAFLYLAFSNGDGKVEEEDQDVIALSAA